MHNQASAIERFEFLKAFLDVFERRDELRALVDEIESTRRKAVDDIGGAERIKMADALKSDAEKEAIAAKAMMAEAKKRIAAAQAAEKDVAEKRASLDADVAAATEATLAAVGEREKSVTAQAVALTARESALEKRIAEVAARERAAADAMKAADEMAAEAQSRLAKMRQAIGG